MKPAWIVCEAKYPEVGYGAFRTMAEAEYEAGYIDPDNEILTIRYDPDFEGPYFTDIED